MCSTLPVPAKAHAALWRPAAFLRRRRRLARLKLQIALAVALFDHAPEPATCRSTALCHT